MRSKTLKLTDGQKGVIGTGLIFFGQITAILLGVAAITGRSKVEDEKEAKGNER